MAYIEKYYVEYCDRNKKQFRLSINELDPAPVVDIVRRGHFNSVDPSEIGIFKEGVDFSFLRIGDTVVISGSTGDDGTYTVTGFSNSVPPDDPYIRIQLSPQVPVTIEEDGVRVQIFAQPQKLKAGPIPFSVSQETSSEIKQGGIFPTRSTITLVSSKVFNMEELYTADEVKYYVTHEPTDGSDDGKWYGHIIPNGFSEEMDDDVHYMVLTASDDLPTLKLKLFEESPGVNYGSERSLIRGQFQQSFMWVAKEALKKTGLTLPIWTIVDIKPALDTFTAPVRIAINVDTNIVTVVDSNRTVKNNIEEGHKLIVTSGTGFNTVNITIDSYTVVSGFNQDTIYITPVEELPGVSETGDAVIEIVPDVPDPSGTYADPLSITVHDIRVYIRDQDIEGKNYYEVNGGALSTWDVLNNLAKQWNAKITQNNGRWEIVRWNAQRVDSGEYDYFVYNSEGVETGREPFGTDVLYPCKSTQTNFRPFGHSISMDRVLGAVGVNYRFKFKTDGDSLINLIKNGNFMPASTPPVGVPFQFTPSDWIRWQSASFGGIPAAMLIVPVYQPSFLESFPPGIGSFIKIAGLYHNRLSLSSGAGYSAPVNAGDELRITWWQRVSYWQHGPMTNYRRTVLKIILSGDDGSAWVLVNSGSNANNQSTISGYNNMNCQWVQIAFGESDWPNLTSSINGGYLPGGMSDWGQVKISSPGCPVNGKIVVEIVGAATATSLDNEPDRQPNFVPVYQPSSGGVVGRTNIRLSSSEIHISGFFVAKIVDPSNDKVSQIHPYWVENDGNYTDSIDDVEVITGDDDNPDHVSNIYVLDGGNQRSIKSWDSWASDYGWGALGLILAKSVLEQYYRPWRIIDGDFVAPHIDWFTRFYFEERPGELYAILRGTIDRINNRFSGTIVQVYDESTPPLPGGGNDGGNTTEPNWQPTGVVRCVRDENGENTGEQEQQEVDTNPASTTQGLIRWINIGENTGSCPIGEPIDIYWGASSDFPVDPDTLNYFPYDKDGDAYTVAFDNDGTGKHLVFLHRASLGTVQSIIYPGTSWNAYGDLPSWEYLADMTINGYTYKAMRQIYPSGTFTGMGLTFTIQ